MKCLGALKTISAAVAIAGAGVLSFAQSASAVTVDFFAIPDGGALAGAGQVVLNVTDLGTGAQFDWTMVAGVNPNMDLTEIYFDDRTPIFTPPINITTQTGTTFNAGSASPGNLPGGGSLTPAFSTTAMLLADADNPGPAPDDGLNIGDNLIFNINYAAGQGFADLLTALGNGQFRIGFHARSLLNGNSEGFVNLPPATVPLPAAGFLLIGALGGLGLMARRKKRKAA